MRSNFNAANHGDDKRQEKEEDASEGTDFDETTGDAVGECVEELGAVEKQSMHESIASDSSGSIRRVRTTNGTILIDYYTTDDPSYPQNWSQGKKTFVTFLIGIYTIAVYMGSSIYSTSEQGVAKAFNVSIEVAQLGLAIFVLVHAFGPMLWSPLSEWPAIGRNPPYIFTQGMFVVISVPTALVDNFAGLLVLRFLQGLFASPALATGAASLSGMYPSSQAPCLVSLWSFAGVCDPALGPLISGFSVQAKNWRWSLWEELWMSGPIFVVLFFFLPETLSAKILLRCAKRIRALTGNPNFVAQSEMDQRGMSVQQTAYDVLIKPFQLNLLDPSIAFTSVYCALIYGILYSFFECLPFVYGNMFHWNEGEQGLGFLAMAIGVGLSLIYYWAYLYKVGKAEVDEVDRPNDMRLPERRLIPALFASFLLPIGLFIFAWTARPDVHWIGTLIGIAISSWGFFIVFQSIFVYLAMSYPQYAASLFAGNNFGRSSGAVATVEFSRPMFMNLGVGPGVSLLAGLCVVCIAGMFVLWWFGPKLRARSRFTQKTRGQRAVY